MAVRPVSTTPSSTVHVSPGPVDFYTAEPAGFRDQGPENGRPAALPSLRAPDPRRTNHEPGACSRCTGPSPDPGECRRRGGGPGTTLAWEVARLAGPGRV